MLLSCHTGREIGNERFLIVNTQEKKLELFPILQGEVLLYLSLGQMDAAVLGPVPSLPTRAILSPVIALSVTSKPPCPLTIVTFSYGGADPIEEDSRP
jgi:hypothetical protein